MDKASDAICSPAWRPGFLLGQSRRIPIPEQLYPFRWLLALGLIALLIWSVRRIANPQKFRLRRSPGRPNSLMLLHAMALFVLFLLLGQLAALARPSDGRAPTSRQMLLLTSGQLLAQTVLLAASLLLARSNFRHGLRRGLGLSLRRWRTDVLRGLVAYLVVFPACLVLLALMNYLWPDLQQAHQILRWIVQSPWPVQLLLAVSAVVVAPLAEEVYFRGILQTSVRNLTRSKWSAILIASGVFAVVHPIVLHWPPLFVLSLALGYNYERTGRLLPSIVLHGLFNGVIVSVTLLTAAGGTG